MGRRGLVNRAMGFVAALAPGYTLYVIASDLLHSPPRGGLELGLPLSVGLVYAAAALALLARGASMAPGAYSASVTASMGLVYAFFALRHGVAYADARAAALLLTAPASLAAASGRRRLSLVLVAAAAGLAAYAATHTGWLWLTAVRRCSYTVVESAPLGAYLVLTLAAALAPGRRGPRLLYSWGLLVVYLYVLQERPCTGPGLAASIAGLAALAAAPLLVEEAGAARHVVTGGGGASGTAGVLSGTGGGVVAPGGVEAAARSSPCGLDLALSLGLWLGLDAVEGCVEED